MGKYYQRGWSTWVALIAIILGNITTQAQDSSIVVYARHHQSYFYTLDTTGLVASDYNLGKDIDSCKVDEPFLPVGIWTESDTAYYVDFQVNFDFPTFNLPPEYSLDNAVLELDPYFFQNAVGHPWNQIDSNLNIAMAIELLDSSDYCTNLSQNSILKDTLSLNQDPIYYTDALPLVTEMNQLGRKTIRFSGAFESTFDSLPTWGGSIVYCSSSHPEQAKRPRITFNFKYTPPACPDVNIDSVVVTREATCQNPTYDFVVYACGENKPLLYKLDGGVPGFDSVFLDVPGGMHLLDVRNSAGDSTILDLSLDPVEFGLKDVEILQVGCSAEGSIQANGCAGIQPYEFIVYNDQMDSLYAENTTLSSPAFPNGTYFVVLNDSQGLSDTTEVLINVQGGSSGQLPSFSVVQPTCPGKVDGKIVFTETGDNISFSINGGGTYSGSPIFSNLPAGNYELLSKDDGCLSDTAYTVLIADYDFQVDNVAIIQNGSCSPTNDAIVDLGLVGGEAPYSYNYVGGFLSPDSILKTLPGDSTLLFYGIDANGCYSDTLPFIIPYLGKITIAEEIITQPTCDPYTDGSVEVTAVPGKNPMQIHWLNEPGYSTNFTNSALGDTSFSYVVRDANGCLSDTNLVTINYTGKLRLPHIVSTAVGCTPGGLGEVHLLASGGNPSTYEYSFNNGLDWSPQSDSIDIPFGTSLTVMGRSDTLCVSDPTVIVIDSVSVVDTLSVTVQSVLCPNDADGSITVNVTGAVGEVLYSLNGGAKQSSNVFNNLNYQPGGYNINVYSDDKCDPSIPQKRKVDNFRVFMQQVNPLTFNGFSRIPITCRDSADGSITIFAGGGAAPLAFSVDGGNSFGDTNVVENLSNGFYQIMVQDANGCETETVETILENPASLAIGNIQQTAPACWDDNDGSLLIAAYGESDEFNFSIDSGLTFQSSRTFAGLTGGFYDIVVADIYGCDTIATRVQLITPDTLKSSIELLQYPSCFDPVDGSVQLAATGGTKPYTFEREFGIFNNDGNFNDLSPGNFRFRSRDIKGCKTEWIDFTVPEPIFPGFDTLIVTPISCFGKQDGQVVLVPDAPGDHTFAHNFQGFQPSPIFFSLPKGMHSFSIKNAFGCQSPWVEVEVIEPELLSLTGMMEVDSMDCYGDSALVLLLENGGTAPYEYSVQAGFTQSNDSGYFSLPGGTFDAWVRDARGCLSAYEAYTVFEPAPLSLNPFIIDQTPSAGGRIIFNVSGGTEPLEYKLDGGAFQEDHIFDDLTKGYYWITVQDDNGCTDSVEVFVDGPTGLGELVQQHFTVYPNPANEKITIEAVGGVAIQNWTMHNSMGQWMQSGKSMEVDVEHVPDGVYYLRLNAGEYTEVIRFTKVQ